VNGSEAWAAAGPLSYRALVGSENIDLLPVPVVGGVLDVPALPPTAWRSFEVLDRSGEVMWSERPQSDGDSLVLALPAPFEIQLVVRDADGAPLPGVTIHHHICNYWFTSSPAVMPADRFRCLWPVCGVTDAAGTLRMRLCVEGAGSDHPPSSLHLMARKPGFRASLGGFCDGKPYRDGRKTDLGGLEFKLAKAEPYSIKLAPSPWAPVKASPLLLTWRVHVRDREGGGAMGLPFQEVAKVGDDVLLAVAPPKGDELETGWSVLPEASGRAPGAGGARPVALRATIAGTPLGGYQLRFPVEDFRKLQLESADGRPVERAVVMVSPIANGGPQPDRGRLLRSDRLGRVLLPVREGSFHVAVVTGTGAGGAVLKADDKEWRLQLRPLSSVTGRAVGDDGKPVSGVGVRAANFSSASRNGADEDVHPAELGYLYGSLPAAMTDADGHFTLAYVPCEGSLSLGVVDPLGRWRVRDSASFACAAGETPGDLVVNVTSSNR
jgi:hypothetical protein